MLYYRKYDNNRLSVSFELNFQISKNIKWQKSVKLYCCKCPLSELCLSLNMSRNIRLINSRQQVMRKMVKLSDPKLSFQNNDTIPIITTESWDLHICTHSPWENPSVRNTVTFEYSYFRLILWLRGTKMKGVNDHLSLWRGVRFLIHLLSPYGFCHTNLIPFLRALLVLFFFPKVSFIPLSLSQCTHSWRPVLASIHMRSSSVTAV